MNFAVPRFVLSIMRRFVDSFGEVLRAMWAHKLRSFLTMFGIAWGVGSLLLLVGLGEGFRAGTSKNLASFGEDYMQIYNGRVPAVGSSQLSSRQYYLNYQDYLDIRSSQFVRNATPVIYRGDLRLVSEYGSSNGYVDGSEPQFYRHSLPADRPRALVELERRTRAPQRLRHWKRIRAHLVSRPSSRRQHDSLSMACRSR